MIDVADLRLATLVDPAAAPELLATGYHSAEGPVWIARDGATSCPPTSAPSCATASSPRGSPIPTPEPALDLHWGAPDWSTLYITTKASLLRLPTRTTGRREPFMA